MRLYHFYFYEFNWLFLQSSLSDNPIFDRVFQSTWSWYRISTQQPCMCCCYPVLVASVSAWRATHPNQLANLFSTIQCNRAGLWSFCTLLRPFKCTVSLGVKCTVSLEDEYTVSLSAKFTVSIGAKCTLSLSAKFTVSLGAKCTISLEEKFTV